MADEGEKQLRREIAKAIGPIVEHELRTWRYHMRTMATTDPDGLLPDQSAATVSGDITRKVADYLAIWLDGRASAP